MPRAISSLGHLTKRWAVQRLLAKRDFLLVTEAHATAGGKLAYTNLPGTTSWWSVGTADRAGVGIIATTAFVNKFRLIPPIWAEVEPGRLAVLHLRATMATSTWQCATCRRAWLAPCSREWPWQVRAPRCFLG